MDRCALVVTVACSTVEGMTAQPIHQDGPPDSDDPVEIVRVLPERYRAQFRAEYAAAAERAAGNLGAYRDLARLLRLWRLRAAAYTAPGYADRSAAAPAAQGDEVPIERLVADWPHRPAR